MDGKLRFRFKKDKVSAILGLSIIFLLLSMPVQALVWGDNIVWGIEVIVLVQPTTTTSPTSSSSTTTTSSSSTTSTTIPPWVSDIWSNQTSILQGGTLEVNLTIQDGGSVLDKVWFTWNGIIQAIQAAISGSNILTWDTTGSTGTYDIIGYVNDSQGNVNSTDTDWSVAVVFTTTTSTTLTSTTSTSTISISTSTSTTSTSTTSTTVVSTSTSSSTSTSTTSTTTSSTIVIGGGGLGRITGGFTALVHEQNLSYNELFMQRAIDIDPKDSNKPKIIYLYFEPKHNITNLRIHFLSESHEVSQDFETQIFENKLHRIPLLEYPFVKEEYIVVKVELWDEHWMRPYTEDGHFTLYPKKRYRTLDIFYIWVLLVIIKRRNPDKPKPKSKPKGRKP